MPDSSRLLGHAQAAVDRALRTVAAIRKEAERQSCVSRQQCLLLEQSAYELGKRQAMLSEMYLAMSTAPVADLPDLWSKFFGCYDDFVEAERRLRLALIEAEFLSGPADRPSTGVNP